MAVSTCKYSAVVFDLDGVLVDSEPLHLKSVEMMLARRNIQLTPDQAAAQTGITIHKFVRMIVEDWGYPGPKEGENWVAEKRAIFRDLAEAELETVKGVDELLRALVGKTKIGLASSSPRYYIDWCIERFNWNGLFETVCTFEDVTRPKPDPEMYLLTSERLGVNGGSALAFEDSPAGVESAVAAGYDCAGIATSYDADRLAGCGARWVIDDFTATDALDDILNSDDD